MKPGPLLATGRDADIFEYGPGLVLRRSRSGRSMAREAETMIYLRDQGYPVPAVDHVSSDGCDLVMERIEGRTMLEALGAAPWTLRRHAHTLAKLHDELHDVTPSHFLGSALVGGPGNRILHLDLHPLNVMLGRQGPVVIDWTNAALGDPPIDVGLAWLLMAAGEIPGGRWKAALLGRGRALFVNSFLHRFDSVAVTSRLRDVVAWKVQDANMSEFENARMWRLVEEAELRQRLT